MKKTVIIATSFILLVILLLIDWREKPKEWALGKWYEPQFKVYAVVDPEIVTLEYSPGKFREFRYEIFEETGEFVVWDALLEKSDRNSYEGLFEFKGKNKVNVREKPTKRYAAGNMEGLVQNIVTNWQRVKEGK